LCSRLGELRFVEDRQNLGEVPVSPFLMGGEVRFPALFEHVEEDRPVPLPVQKNGAKPSRTALTLTGDALLDELRAKFGVNDSRLSPLNSLDQIVIRNFTRLRPAGENLGREHFHGF
jgi:hypothetical protein